MYDACAVQVVEPEAHLARDVGDLRLGQPLLQVHDDRVERAAVAKLDEQLKNDFIINQDKNKTICNLIVFVHFRRLNKKVSSRPVKKAPNFIIISDVRTEVFSV